MKKISLLIIFFVIFITCDVNAAYSGNNKSICISSKYQDSNKNTYTNTTFSHCLAATCNNGKYELDYVLPNTGVLCLNGNKNPYVIIKENGCSTYQNNSCSTNGNVNYCSMLIYYDCERISGSGNSFTTTTKKTTSTTKKSSVIKSTTKKTTTTTKIRSSNSKLKDLSLSSGVISFNSDVYLYNIEVESDVNSIDVNTEVEDKLSSVVVSGNSNIINGSVITILVTAEDGSSSEYKINITKKEVVLSNDSSLSELSVENYTIPFSSSFHDYNLTISSNENSLKINCKTTSDKATFKINDNNNLENGSVVSIVVTAEDGSSSTYNIYVFVKKKSNVIKIIFIFIVIIAFCLGGYYLYKKIISKREGGGDYEYE